MHRPTPARAFVSRFPVAVLSSAITLVLATARPADAAVVRPVALAPITLQRAIATPIMAASPCTVEPKDPLYGDTAFDPAVETEWFGGVNFPSVDDVIPDTAAGANRDFCVGYELPPDVNNVDLFRTIPADMPRNPNTAPAGGDDQKNIVIDLPRGFSGNLANIDACSDADFGADGSDTTASAAARGPANCADDAVVGDAVVRISTTLLGVHALVGGANTPGFSPAPDGIIWKLNSGPNELGRLGVQVVPAGLGGVKPSKFVVRLTLDPDGSGRVRATVLNAPRTHFGSGVKDLYIEGVWMRMWGAAADHPGVPVDPDGASVPTLHGDFAETPTDCSAAASAHVAVTTYGGARTADPATYAPVSSEMTAPAFTVTGCDQLPFAPSVAVMSTAHTPSTPTGLTVTVGLGQGRVGGRLPALLRDAAVTLPTGVELGAQAGGADGGLAMCTTDQFGAATPLTPNACPAATVAGDVTIHSPLIDQSLVGKVYLGRQAAVGDLPDLYLEVALAGATAPDAPRIKLVGTTTVDDQGRITATFLDAPQLRFDALSITFPGGPHALFSTPPACGTASATSSLRSYASPVPVSVTDTLTIDQGCEVPAFSPTVSVEQAAAKAGAKSATRIVIARRPAEPWIRSLNVSLPGGLLADLNGVPECAAASAATGDCPAATRIGGMHVLAGAGDAPFPLDGTMYLTERQPGAVAGAVLVTRAKIGALDLGTVVVPGRIELRPTDAGLDFKADLPVRFHGLALQLQRVQVDLDRDGFALNPTACGPLAYSAAATGTGGETAKAGGSVTYPDCAALPFHPTLHATLTGDNRPGGHPGMFVVLDARPGDSAMHSASVMLPAGVAADIKNVANSCERASFDAGTCPAITRVGRASAEVTITPDVINGDVFLVKVPGQPLPGLGLAFTGRFAQRVVSTVKIAPGGRLVTDFAAIPDLPLRRLTIDVASGPHSPLQLPAQACANGTRWDGTFVGQGGQQASAQSGLQCAAPAEVRLSDRRGLSLRLFDFGGRHLASAKVTLPAGWRVNPTQAKRPGATWVRLRGAGSTVAFTTQSVTVRTTDAMATTIRCKVDGTGVFALTKAARRAKTAVVKVRLAFTDGTVQTQSVTVKTG